MAFIYHIVPKKLSGTRLIPLNEMKKLLPEVFVSEAKKYMGREKILERSIPKINCLWNDVLHFSPVSPEIIYSRLEELGFGKYPELKWFKIPIQKISNSPAVIYTAPLNPRPDFKLAEEDVEIFDAQNWKEQTQLSGLAENYFLKCKSESKSPLPFQFTQHVLVKAQVDISDVQIISRI